MTSNLSSPAHLDVLVLSPGQVTLADLRRIYRNQVSLALAPETRAGILAAQQVVQRIVADGAVVYGINTGFGKLAQTCIPPERLAELQRNLVLSHSVGTGAALSSDVVRMILAIKAVSLARGHSGVRPELIDALLTLANRNVLPRIPAKGSVGASGDLAPLAHMAMVLIGEGEALVDGELVSGAEGMRRAGLTPFELGPKEGLALLNGTQVSTALALAGLFEAENVFAAGLMAGCAVAGSDQGLGQAVRCADSRGARPAWADQRRRGGAHAAGGQRSIAFAPELRAGAGPLFDPLRTAGDGRGAR